MFKWLAKKVLPVIAANIDIDIDTVVKNSGTYLRVRAEVFGFTLYDGLHKTSDQNPVENPIDVFDTARAELGKDNPFTTGKALDRLSKLQ